MKLENTKFLMSFLIFYTFGHDSVYIENREVAHDTQSPQIRSSMSVI